MSASWQRWLAYAKAKLDSTLRESEADLDEREARLRAEAEGKPWLSSSSESPTFEEMRARIEHDAREAAERQRRQPPAAPPSPARPGIGPAGGSDDGARDAGEVGEDPLASFDMAAHQKAADDRLAAIRRELGLADDEADEPTSPSPSGPSTPPESPPPDPGADEPDDDTPVAPV